MTMLQTWVIPIVISYLLGSISFSYLLTKWLKGVDIRDYGSGNAGATNTSRVLGKGPAVVVFLLDALKGMAAVGLGYWLANGHNADVMMMVCGIAAIIGHNWPIFLGFRGGKGIATTVGVTLLIGFTAALIAGVCAILFILFTRYVSVGSLVFTTIVPVAMWILDFPAALVWLMLIVTVMAIWRHKQNLINLIKGKERKI
ncbi:glycerol-3-phosphate 1-O-acyltransferase PlsY [Laceyella putida]|uniref:Glycerol-3-phosphate acyltransferase n=1 Tax=Laceyella putida TaxID=110101 RepID=A0ABW2RM82_9BACL